MVDRLRPFRVGYVKIGGVALVSRLGSGEALDRLLGAPLQAGRGDR